MWIITLYYKVKFVFNNTRWGLENAITFANGAKCQFGFDISEVTNNNSNGLNKEISQAEPKFFI